jgi:hypothetical protein
MLVAAAIVNANIFGNIAVILQQLNRKSSKFQEKIENANSSMKSLGIPEHLQHDIVKYLTFTQSSLDHQKELDSFMGLLSPSLKLQVTRYLFLETITNNEIFEGNTETIDSIVKDLSIQLSLPEETIVKHGSIGDTVYFLGKGE